MTARRIGAAVLVAIAWAMAVAGGVVLWGHVHWLNYYLFCWPMNAAVGRWRIDLSLTYVLLALDLLLPAAATLCVRRRPGLAAILAAVQILLMPIAFEALSRWNAGVRY